jgi:hypothetical protein
MKHSIWAVFLLLVASCGGSQSSGEPSSIGLTSNDGGGMSNEGGGTSDDGGACHHAAVGADGSRCNVGKYVLTCTWGAGVEGCVSDSPTSCNDPYNEPDSGVTCENHCETNEYGVACVNDIGLPASCRRVLSPPHPTTASNDSWCCPCQ